MSSVTTVTPNWPKPQPLPAPPAANIPDLPPDWLSTYDEANSALAELADLGWIRQQDRRVWLMNPIIQTL